MIVNITVKVRVKCSACFKETFEGEADLTELRGAVHGGIVDFDWPLPDAPQGWTWRGGGVYCPNCRHLVER